LLAGLGLPQTQLQPFRLRFFVVQLGEHRTHVGLMLGLQVLDFFDQILNFQGVLTVWLVLLLELGLQVMQSLLHLGVHRLVVLV
jgi:hypothetical protein